MGTGKQVDELEFLTASVNQDGLSGNYGQRNKDQIRLLSNFGRYFTRIRYLRILEKSHIEVI